MKTKELHSESMKKDLNRLLGLEKVKTEIEDLLAYSGDATHYYVQSKPEAVADVVLKTALDGKMERITGGALTGIMTHGGYLFPGIKHLTKSMNEAKGRKNREVLRPYRDKVISRYGTSKKIE